MKNYLGLKATRSKSFKLKTLNPPACRIEFPKFLMPSMVQFFADNTDLIKLNCYYKSFNQDLSIRIRKLTWLSSSKLSFNIIKIVGNDVSIDTAFLS